MDSTRFPILKGVPSLNTLLLILVFAVFVQVHGIS